MVQQQPSWCLQTFCKIEDFLLWNLAYHGAGFPVHDLDNHSSQFRIDRKLHSRIGLLEHLAHSRKGLIELFLIDLTSRGLRFGDSFLYAPYISSVLRSI